MSTYCNDLGNWKEKNWKIYNHFVLVHLSWWKVIKTLVKNQVKSFMTLNSTNFYVKPMIKMEICLDEHSKISVLSYWWWYLVSLKQPLLPDAKEKKCLNKTTATLHGKSFQLRSIAIKCIFNLHITTGTGCADSVPINHHGAYLNLILCNQAALIFKNLM